MAGRLQFLADESCDFVVVRALRSAGYDVLAIAEQAAGAPDREVIQLALDDGRVLLTEDKDFGQLVFAAFAGSRGVILIRFPSDARTLWRASSYASWMRTQLSSPAHS